MKFEVKVTARTSCLAKAAARDLVRSWSRSNNATVYIKNTKVSGGGKDKIVTIVAEVEGYGQETVYL